MLIGLLCLCGFWLPVAPVGATIDDLKSYKQAYPGQDAKAYSCKVCHEGAVGKKGDLNAYGLALQKLKAPGDAKKLTEEDYRALEQQEAEEGQAPGGSSGLVPKVRQGLRATLEALTTPEAWAQEKATEPAAEVTPAETSAEKTAPADYVGTETCAACHTKQAKEFQHSTHARIAVPGDSKDVGAQGCETCHGPGSLHVEAGGGKGVGGLINPNKDPSTCFECHLDKKAEFRLPYRHPVMEGKMSCGDCHNAHGEEVKPWSATTLQGINEACFKCHKEQRGPFVYEHEALREGCTSCHKVHGSIHQAMLLVRDSNLCFRCHTQTNFPSIGDRNHSTSFREGTCFSAGCHTAPHGSNFDDHLRY
jgi:predicted CXXCH cytochrome family protein